MENNDLQISKKELIDISYREVEIKEKLKNKSTIRRNEHFVNEIEERINNGINDGSIK